MIKKHYFFKVIRLYFLFIFFLSCSPKSSSPSPTNQAVTQNSAEGLSLPVQTQLNLASASPPAGTLTVQLESFSGPSSSLQGVYQINADPSRVDIPQPMTGESDKMDYSKAYLRWKACLTSDQQCISNDQQGWNKEYSYIVDNLATLPVGNATILVEYCVEDLSFFSGLTASNTPSNQCPNDKLPCYCGQKATTTANITAPQVSPNFQQAMSNFQAGQAALWDLAINYRNQAKAYLAACSTDNTTYPAILNYAKNIVAQSSAQIALEVEVFGNPLAQLGFTQTNTKNSSSGNTGSRAIRGEEMALGIGLIVAGVALMATYGVSAITKKDLGPFEDPLAVDAINPFSEVNRLARKYKALNKAFAAMDNAIAQNDGTKLQLERTNAGKIISDLQAKHPSLQNGLAEPKKQLAEYQKLQITAQGIKASAETTINGQTFKSGSVINSSTLDPTEARDSDRFATPEVENSKTMKTAIGAVAGAAIAGLGAILTAQGAGAFGLASSTTSSNTTSTDNSPCGNSGGDFVTAIDDSESNLLQERTTLNAAMQAVDNITSGSTTATAK